jgi:hypothetical protein
LPDAALVVRKTSVATLSHPFSRAVSVLDLVPKHAERRWLTDGGPAFDDAACRDYRLRYPDTAPGWRSVRRICAAAAPPSGHCVRLRLLDPDLSAACPALETVSKRQSVDLDQICLTKSVGRPTGALRR